ncbi:hypothetical protein KOW79_018946 [Hemibagrus wyckioides]|uniref:Uncharacterized protein n=1 Tax=Hemibagrus wyckioides TaxID=337641 RepID=A0A9D3N824_9TELE|nr:hypothetical protein KOW79_018946 [Hemibagrus wyckioides]
MQRKIRSHAVLREPAQNEEHSLCGPEGQTFTGNVMLKRLKQIEALCHFPIPAALDHSTFSFDSECLFYLTNTQVDMRMTSRVQEAPPPSN